MGGIPLSPIVVGDFEPFPPRETPGGRPLLPLVVGDLIFDMSAPENPWDLQKRLAFVE